AALRAARAKLRRAHARALERAAAAKSVAESVAEGAVRTAVSAGGHALVRASLPVVVGQWSTATTTGQVVAVVPGKLASAVSRGSTSSLAGGAAGCSDKPAAADPEGGVSVKSQPEPEPPFTALVGAGAAQESHAPGPGPRGRRHSAPVPRGTQTLVSRLETEARLGRWQCLPARIACHFECWL
ncbi:unnamed protein product, partial [Prorocentrum cordatum]